MDNVKPKLYERQLSLNLFSVKYTLLMEYQKK